MKKRVILGPWVLFLIRKMKLLECVSSRKNDTALLKVHILKIHKIEILRESPCVSFVSFSGLPFYFVLRSTYVELAVKHVSC